METRTTGIARGSRHRGGCLRGLSLRSERRRTLLQLSLRPYCAGSICAKKALPPAVNGHPIEEQADAFRCIPFAPASSAECIDEQRIVCLGGVIDAHPSHEAFGVLDSHHTAPRDSHCRKAPATRFATSSTDGGGPSCDSARPLDRALGQRAQHNRLHRAPSASVEMIEGWGLAWRSSLKHNRPGPATQLGDARG